MFKLYLGDKEITVIVNYKDNKNTYFRFKNNDTITVNASKLQTLAEIKKYILNNQTLFLRKLEVKVKKDIDHDSFYLFGKKYNIKRRKLAKEARFDHEENILYIPKVDIDHEKKLLEEISKVIFNAELLYLQEKFMNNGQIDISNLKLRSRYMTTRFGSCNPVKRNININLNLIHYDKKFLEYVFLHEVTHLVVRDHSAKFYKLLVKFSPNYKPLRRELNKIYRHR